MKRLGLLISIKAFLILSAFSQSSATSAEIYLGLKKLNVLGSVLYIAAHPDDENTRLLTYFSKDRLYKTGYLSLTRGDGGQNLIGDEQGIELGLIRTQELLAARRIDGAEQFFTRAYDFGYSKTPEETLKKWDKEKILSDVVWVIRKFQPDVIITRFPTTGEGGHGHHTASAILANEAFAIAADPKRFPEQLQYVKPWQAKRVLWNSFNFGGNNTTREDQFKFDVGGYNAVLGKSYGEIAAISRSQHKSQGFGMSLSRGEALEYFQTTGGSAVSKDLFEDVNTNWKRIEGAGRVSEMIDKAIASFDFVQPQKSVQQLVDIYKALKQLPESIWRNQKLDETKKLIGAASGLWIEAFSPQQFAVHGDSVKVNFVFNNRLGINAKLKHIGIPTFDTILNKNLEQNKNFILNKTLFVKESVPLSQPYWLAYPMDEGYFNVYDQQLIGAPEVVKSFVAVASLEIEGENFQFVQPVRYKYTDPVKGEIYEPLVVMPAIVIAPEENIKLTKGSNNFDGNLNVTAQRKDVSASVQQITTKEKANPKASFKPTEITLNKANEVDVIKYQMNAEQDNVYYFALKNNNASSIKYDQQSHQIKYDHIPFINYFSAAAVKNIKLNLETRGKKIGYIIGAGDKVPAALEQMDYDVTLLTEKELSRNNLKQFDAIISGVRAYNTNDWLNKYHDKLMNFVYNGGNLIVQYNTSNQLGPVRSKIGPYDFNISRNRITDENSEVTFLKPQHQVLNYPNKISAEDFKGWVQERSIYHADKADPEFEKIISMSDPGENSNDNSLIVAPYGKGYFTYTGIVFFRQLPAGVPGAYRLLANLIALNQKKEL